MHFFTLFFGILDTEKREERLISFVISIEFVVRKGPLLAAAILPGHTMLGNLMLSVKREYS